MLCSENSVPFIPLLTALLLSACGSNPSSTNNDSPLDRVRWDTPALKPDAPQKVEVGERSLLVNGEPFFVRGAGYVDGAPGLEERGGNSMRTWGEGTAQLALDEARAQGLLVSLGLWVVHSAQGFDYGNEAAVTAHIEQHKRAIDRHKDDPALLLWGIGNEINYPHADGSAADPRAWDVVEELAQYAHEVDPNHPVMSVVTDIDPALIALVKERAPSLDLLGINSYEGLPTLPERLRKAGWDKPYLVTEWSGPGAWASPETPWGTKLELSSGEKAALFQSLHDTLAGDANCFGGYAFVWTNLVAPTPTWFSLFDVAMRPTELLDHVQYAWTGAWPKNRAPSVSALTIDGEPMAEPRGKTLRAAVSASDAEDDALTYTWELRGDAPQPQPGGYGALPPLLFETTTKEPEITIDVPGRAGPYRLYVTVADAKGQVGVANAPFLVEDPQNAAPEVDAKSHFHLGEFYEGQVSDGATLSAEALTSVWDRGSQLLNMRGDVEEGHVFHRVVAGSTGWLGAGVAYDQGIDLTPWTTLRVSLRSRTAAAQNLLMVILGDTKQVAAEQGSMLLAKDYGFRSDGEWHELVIPLADFPEKTLIDLADVQLGFGLSLSPAKEGDAVDIDGLHLTAE